MTASRAYLPVAVSALLMASFVASAQVQGEESAAGLSSGILPLADYSGDPWERGCLLGDFGGSQ